jgi:mRNA interferase MazF
LVLSARTFNQRNGHTLLAMITTAARTRWPSDYPIRELPPTGLRVACVVRWKLFTLDNRALQRRVGRLGERDRQDCRAALAVIFDDRQAQ